MRNNYLLFIFLFLFYHSSFAQNSWYVKETQQFIEDKKFDNAIHLLDSVIKGNYGPVHSCYYYKGYVYKLKYTSTKSENYLDSSLINFSSSKLFSNKLIKKDDSDNTKISNKALEDNITECNKNIMSLVSRIYNEATVALAKNKIDSAEYFFRNYKKGVHLIPDSAKFKNKDIDFYLVCNTLYYKQYELNKNENKNAFEKSIEYCKKVLAIDSNNYRANYYLLTKYYNLGVYNISMGGYKKQLEVAKEVDWSDPNTEVPNIEELLSGISTDDFEKYDVATEFNKALPYGLKIYSLEPNNKNAIVALNGIYFAKNDKKNYTAFKDKLVKLKSQKK